MTLTPRLQGTPCCHGEAFQYLTQCLTLSGYCSLNWNHTHKHEQKHTVKMDTFTFIQTQGVWLWIDDCWSLWWRLQSGIVFVWHVLPVSWCSGLAQAASVPICSLALTWHRTWLHVQQRATAYTPCPPELVVATHSFTPSLSLKKKKKTHTQRILYVSKWMKYISVRNSWQSLLFYFLCLATSLFSLFLWLSLSIRLSVFPSLCSVLSLTSILSPARVLPWE